MARVYSVAPILFHRFSGVDVENFHTVSERKTHIVYHAPLLIDIDSPGSPSMSAGLRPIRELPRGGLSGSRHGVVSCLGQEWPIGLGSLQEGLKLAQGLGNNLTWRCTLLDRFLDFPIEILHLIRKDNTRAVRRIIEEHFKWVAFLLASHRATEH
jgi:hypothetical protein